MPLPAGLRPAESLKGDLQEVRRKADALVLDVQLHTAVD
jgi:hypothetical protein